MDDPKLFSDTETKRLGDLLNALLHANLLLEDLGVTSERAQLFASIETVHGFVQSNPEAAAVVALTVLRELAGRLLLVNRELGELSHRCKNFTNMKITTSIPRSLTPESTTETPSRDSDA